MTIRTHQTNTSTTTIAWRELPVQRCHHHDFAAILRSVLDRNTGSERLEMLAD